MKSPTGRAILASLVIRIRKALPRRRPSAIRASPTSKAGRGAMLGILAMPQWQYFSTFQISYQYSNALAVQKPDTKSPGLDFY